MALVDYEDPRIERNIGDKNKRTPHFVQDTKRLESGETTGVLYIPHPNGAWTAAAFHSPKDAIHYLDKHMDQLVEQHLAWKNKEK